MIEPRSGALFITGSRATKDIIAVHNCFSIYLLLFAANAERVFGLTTHVKYNSLATSSIINFTCF